MALLQLKQVAEEVGVFSEQGVAAMLHFYHDLGMVIYRTEPGALDAALQSMVILRPQWLVDVFKRITLANLEDAEVGGFGVV